MRIVSLQDLMSGNELTNIHTVLNDGGVVCVPCRSSYRLIADFTNIKAINALLQSKQRTARAPSLVFIPKLDDLKHIVQRIPLEAHWLAKELWPGELTIRFEPNKEKIDHDICRSLFRGKGKIGVRVPSEPWILKILDRFDRPLLVSSANREKKGGALSPAMIRKNFLGHIDIFVDAGDIPRTEPSTVIDFKGEKAFIKREGSISSAKIENVLNKAAE